MYAGSTLTKNSGSIFGAHQKIDKVARRHIDNLLPNNNFPGIKQILHFEGDNGPDGIKRKSPAKDEPWHFIRPYDLEDIQLITLIKNHYIELVKALESANDIRAAFEAAWLSHAMVDGLTPAHHYPYEEKLKELRNGQDLSTRTNMKERLIMSGDKKTEMIVNNWKMWGPKGLFTTHAAFEGGVATIIAPLTLQRGIPSVQLIAQLKKDGIDVWFRKQAQQIADLQLYDIFYKYGWTTNLTRQIRSTLAPLLVQTVTCVWYLAIEQSMNNIGTI